MSFTRVRYLLVAVMVLAFAVIAGSASMASASSSGAHEASTAQPYTALNSSSAKSPAVGASPDEFIGCVYGIDKPFFLTTGSKKMYTSGGITSCTDPAPESCKLTVEILANNGALWVVAKQAVRNWGPCSNTKPLSAGPFTCSVTPEKAEFEGQATLQIEVNGKYSSTSKGSGIVEYYCQA
jgi:hypothetical protein